MGERWELNQWELARESERVEGDEKGSNTKPHLYPMNKHGLGTNEGDWEDRESEDSQSDRNYQQTF